MVTIRDIAKLAGVSNTTVIRALHNIPYIRPEVRQRVLDIAAQYAYRPAWTSSRTTTESMAVGVIVPNIASHVFSRILKGILFTANTVSCQVMVLENEHLVANTCMAFRMLCEHGVKGIIMASGVSDNIATSEGLALWSHGVHLISVDDYMFGEELAIDYIGNDFSALMRTAINYLHHLHHQHIIYLSSPTGVHYAERPRGMQILRVLHQYDIPVYFSDDTLEAVDRTLLAAMSRSPRPTAILAWSDKMAAMATSVLSRRGIAVPTEISVLGIGNDPLCAVMNPALSSVDQHFQDMGKQAMQLLYTRIQSNEPPSSYQKQHIVVPVDVIPRASCLPLRAR